MKMRAKITTSAANVSSLDDPDVEKVDGRIDFLVTRDYEKVKEFFPKEWMFQEVRGETDIMDSTVIRDLRIYCCGL